MARNGAGTYVLPSNTVSPAVSDTVISSADFNALTADLALALTQSLSNDGQTVLIGGLDFNGNSLILDTNGDTSITADTDDQIDFALGGTDIVSFAATQITFTIGSTNVANITEDGLDSVENANEIIKQQVFS